MTKILENMEAVQEKRQKMLSDYREKVQNEQNEEYSDDEFEREEISEEIEEEVGEDVQPDVMQVTDQWEITMQEEEKPKPKFDDSDDEILSEAKTLHDNIQKDESFDAKEKAVEKEIEEGQKPKEKIEEECGEKSQEK